VFTAQLFVVGFFTYAVSLLVAPVRETFGASLEQVMYSLTVATFIGMVLTPLAGVLIDRLSVRWLMAAGTLFYGLGLLALARTSSIGQYIAVFSITMSVANCFAGPMCGSAVIARWFTVSRGRALGLAAVGTSVGGVLVPALVTRWLEQGGWQGAVENFALVVLLVMLPLVVLTVRGRPADVGLAPESDGSGEAAAAALPDPQLGLRDIAASGRFWFIAVCLGLLFSVYSATLSNITPYAVNLGRSSEQASALIMAVAIGGLVGKLLFGMAADRFDLRAGLWAAQILVIAGLLLLALEPSYGVMLLAATLLGLAAGGMLPVWGAMVAQAFGLASYGRAMGLMGPVITLCVMPGFAVMGRLYDVSGSYTSGLYLFAALTVVGAALLLPLRLQAPARS
jgi:MFS family permease